MGMSASQARFLGLTARKSNVEFQGQQVNQQRTSLANESAGLFNQMLALQVPTPPSATDFYSMAYTFPGEASNEECRILTWGTSSNPTMGAYNVEIKKTINDVGVKTPTMAVGTTITKSDEVDAAGNPIYTMGIPDSSGNIINYTLTKADKDVNGVKQEDGKDTYIPSYSYQKGGRTYFVSEELLNKMFGEESNLYGVTEENGSQTAHITKENQDAATESYYKGEKTVEYITLVGVTMETDDTGRFTGMKYSPTNDPNSMKETELTIEEIHDDEGYDKAMQEYNYKKMMYDRTIEDINTRTEIIQQQDKTLELNLKQLDTEQEAIQTEMEAVQQVIQKNVENTFKTFA